MRNINFLLNTGGRIHLCIILDLFYVSSALGMLTKELFRVLEICFKVDLYGDQ